MASSVVLEGYLPVGNTKLYYRQAGIGQSIIVLHGGPDFDHIFEGFQLIYYDQRGRGKSGGKVRPEEVSLASEIADLEALQAHFQLETLAVLGHSWGGLLALEYTLRHPEHVSRIILMNTAPATHDDLLLFRQARLEKAAGDLEKLKAIASTDRYKQGDPETDAEYYRIHMRLALRRTEYLERVVNSLRANVTSEGILKARAIEERLYDETWRLREYDLLPGLSQLRIPALVLHGE